MPLKTQHDEQPSINLTPMIDIVFLLIIFFMVGTKFSELSEAERDLALQVPEVAETGTITSAPKKRVINVFPDGRIILDEEPVDLKTLKEKLVASVKQYAKTGVVIRGDASSAFQNVAEVVAVCHQAEISDLNLSVRVAKLEQ